MTCVFMALCAFDTGVVLTEFAVVFVAFAVLILLILAVKVFVLFGVFAVLVSDAVFLFSLCLVALQEMKTYSTTLTSV